MKQFQLEEPRKHCTKQVSHRTNQMCQDDESLLEHSRIKCTKQVPHRTNQMCQDDEILITILIIQEYKRVKSEPTIQSQSRLTSSTSIQLQALQLIFVDLLKILINKQKQQVFFFTLKLSTHVGHRLGLEVCMCGSPTNSMTPTYLQLVFANI